MSHDTLLAELKLRAHYLQQALNLAQESSRIDILERAQSLADSIAKDLEFHLNQTIPQSMRVDPPDSN